MLRRVLSSLLAILLLAQGITWPHAHAGNEPPGHEGRPHFHFSGLHQHDHEHPYHHHHHDADHDDDPASNPLLGPAQDHDADAVYLPACGTLATVGRDPVSIDCTPSTGLLSWPAPCIPPLDVPEALPPPLLGRYHCPLYLQSLVLLI